MADIHERFTQAFAAIGAITKDQKNAHHGYSYRGIDDVLNRLHTVFKDAGIFYTPRMVSEEYDEWQTSRGNRLQVARIAYAFDFYAPDGSSLTVGPVVGQSADTDDKAPMQALSQAAKYALLQAFCIPTQEMDPDAVSPVSGNGEATTPQVSRPSAREESTVQIDAKRKGYFANMKKLGAEGDEAKQYVKDMYELDSFNDATYEQLTTAYKHYKENKVTV